MGLWGACACRDDRMYHHKFCIASDIAYHHGPCEDNFTTATSRSNHTAGETHYQIEHVRGVAVCSRWSAIEALQPMVCNRCSAINGLQSMLCSRWSAIDALQSMVCNRCSAIDGLQSRLCSQWSAIVAWQSVVCNRCPSVDGLQSMPYSQGSAIDDSASALRQVQ